jgi:RNA polymerase sigma-70 factor (ECF subfamily)
MRAQEDDLGSLVARCAQGDSRALASLYDRTSSLVNGLALRILNDRSAAEEITGDVYLQVWRTAQSYDPQRGNPVSWLLTLTRSRAIDRLRSVATERRQTEPLAEVLTAQSSDPGPEEDTAVSQRRRLVKNALARLAAEQRRAIELAYYGGMSHSEIAATLGEPLGTVKTRVRLGMMRLREMLGGSGREALL